VKKLYPENTKLFAQKRNEKGQHDVLSFSRKNQFFLERKNISLDKGLFNGCPLKTA
jgi:hypothetical protein